MTQHTLTDAFSLMLGDDADPKKVSQALEAATIKITPPTAADLQMMETLAGFASREAQEKCFVTACAEIVPHEIGGLSKEKGE